MHFGTENATCKTRFYQTFFFIFKEAKWNFSRKKNKNAGLVKSREIIVPNSANTFSSTQSIRPVVVIKSRGRHRSDSREGPRAIYFKVDMKFRTSMFSVLYGRFYVRVLA